MSCEACEKKTDLTEETKAVKAASELQQRYKLLCASVVALVVGFVIMAGCMVWAVTNAQSIANEAVLQALYTVAEMEVSSETTTTTTTTTEVTQDTGEGSGNNVYLDGDGTTYNESGDE